MNNTIPPRIQEIINVINDLYPGEFKDFEWILVRKPNFEKYGLKVYDTQSNNSPIFYLEDVLENYTNEEIATFIHENSKASTENNDKLISLLRQKVSSGQVLAKVISVYDNEELLEMVPHRLLGDLALVYIVEFKKDGVEYSSVISTPILESCKKTEADLFRCAKKHFSKPIMIETSSLFIGTFAPNQQQNECYMITNKDQKFGASLLFFPEAFYAISKKIKDDLVITPTSIHELMVSKYSPEIIERSIEALKNINATLPPEERVTEDIYIYYRDSQEIMKYTPMKKVLQR